MSGVRVLAKSRRRVSLGTTMPAAFAQDATNPATVDEADAALYASGAIAPDYNLMPMASDEIDDAPIDSVGNAKGIGTPNFTGGFSVYRFFNSSGVPDETDDAVYDLLDTAARAGTPVYVYSRKTSKMATAAWATSDPITVIECLVDVPAEPDANATTEYIKERFEMKPQRWARGTLAAGSGSAVPLISSALPSGAAVTEIVTITGARFTGTTDVDFGATPATAFSVISDNLLVATMPAGSAGAANIVVTNAAGASSAFTYTRGA